MASADEDEPASSSYEDSFIDDGANPTYYNTPAGASRPDMMAVYRFFLHLTILFSKILIFWFSILFNLLLCDVSRVWEGGEGYMGAGAFERDVYPGSFTKTEKENVNCEVPLLHEVCELVGTDVLHDIMSSRSLFF